MVDFQELINVDNIQNESQLWFETTPLWKIFLLSTFTFGFYEIVIFYNYWKTLKDKFGENVSPFWRGFFAGIMNFWLFPELSKYIKAHNIKPFHPILLAIIYIIFLNCYRLPDNYFYLSYASAFIIMIVQYKINKVNKFYYPNAKQNKWTIANTIWAIIIPIIFIGGGFIYGYATALNSMQ